MKSDYLEEDWEDWDETNSTLDKCTIDEASQNFDSSDDQHINSIMTEIKGLLLNITDSNIHSNMNRKLHKTSYNQFIKYYQSNPNLANYTIQNELNRLQFTVIFQQNHYIKKEDIVNIYRQIPNHILWRLANQSIFSELLNIMQNTFPIKELYLSLSSKFCSFYLDFDSSILRTESVFSFQSLNQHTNKSGSPSPSSSSKLTELATIQGHIEINSSSQTIQQSITSPSLSILFDDQIRLIAKSISQLHTDLSREDVGGISGSSSNAWEDSQGALAVSKQILNSAGEVALVTGYGFLESMVASVGKVLGADAGHRENSSAFSEVLRRLPPPPPLSPMAGVPPVTDAKVPVTTTVFAIPASDSATDLPAADVSLTISDNNTLFGAMNHHHHHHHEISSKAGSSHSESSHVTTSQDATAADLKRGGADNSVDNEKNRINDNKSEGINIMYGSIPNSTKNVNDSSQPVTETWDDW